MLIGRKARDSFMEKEEELQKDNDLKDDIYKKLQTVIAKIKGQKGH